MFNGGKLDGNVIVVNEARTQERGRSREKIPAEVVEDQEADSVEVVADTKRGEGNLPFTASSNLIDKKGSARNGSAFFSLNRIKLAGRHYSACSYSFLSSTRLMASAI